MSLPSSDSLMVASPPAFVDAMDAAAKLHHRPSCENVVPYAAVVKSSAPHPT
jgi:hypothetical protein